MYINELNTGLAFVLLGVGVTTHACNALNPRSNNKKFAKIVAFY